MHRTTLVQTVASFARRGMISQDSTPVIVRGILSVSRATRIPPLTVHGVCYMMDVVSRRIYCKLYVSVASKLMCLLIQPL